MKLFTAKYWRAIQEGESGAGKASALVAEKRVLLQEVPFFFFITLKPRVE